MSNHEPSTDPRVLVRQQFGANAANYATSKVHAKGASLARLVEVMEPQAHWQLLDVATAAGHTAFAFAPHVAGVVASDLTDEMLAVAADQATERGLDNVTVRSADAEALPFEDGSFDAVTCRIAPHHFPQPAVFVSEVARVLRPGGRFGLVDNMVNDEAADFVNDWERKRDPSHVLALSLDRWLEHIVDAGLGIISSETMAKRMGFQAWVDNMNVPADTRVELLAELRQAPAAAAAYLRPELPDSDLTDGDPSDGDSSGGDLPDGGAATAAFYLTEGIVVAAKPAAS